MLIRPSHRIAASVATVAAILLAPNHGAVESVAAASDVVNVYVCLYPTSGSREQVCIGLGDISRMFSQSAVALADVVRGIAKTVPGATTSAASALVINSQFISRWLSTPQRVGCVASAGQTIAVLLSRTADTTRLSDAQRAAFASQCGSVVPAGTNTLLDSGASLFAAVSDADAFVADFQNELNACMKEQQTTAAGHARLIMPTEGKPKEKTALEKLKIMIERLAPSGGQDKNVHNDAPGSRGSCLEPGDCYFPNCHDDAQIKALAAYLFRHKYTGCNINATPRPDGPDECAKARTGQKLTPAETKQIREHVCKLKGTVAAAGEGTTFRCLETKPATMARQTDVCRDPRAMCSEQGRPTPPRTGVKQQMGKLDPRPPLPTGSFLPPGFEWANQR